MTEQPHNTFTILRRKQVQARLGLARSTLYDKLNSRSPRHDPTFPKPIKIGIAAIGFIESEIQAWLESRLCASRGESKT